jgi:hypothetical protein
VIVLTLPFIQKFSTVRRRAFCRFASTATRCATRCNHAAIDFPTQSDPAFLARIRNVAWNAPSAS